MSLIPNNTAARLRPRGLRARGTLLLLAAALPFLAGADVDDGDTLEARRLRVEAMGAVERAALQHNFETYQKLSAAEREKYRGLHHEVQQNAELVRVLQKYGEWLGTLSAAQREELRKAPDATVRMQLVKSFREEQERQRSNRFSYPPSLPWIGTGSRPYPGGRMAAAGIVPVMGVLESRARLPETKLKDWDSLTPAQKHTRILAGVFRQAEEAGRGPWSDETLQNDMIQAIPDEQARNVVRNAPRGEPQRQMLLLMILRALHVEWQGEIEKQRPREADLQKFFAEVDERQRDELIRMPHEERDRLLLWTWMGRQEGTLADDFREFRQIVQKIGPKGRPPGERPATGDRRPDGDRGPGGDRRPEGKRPGDRFAPRDKYEAEGPERPERPPPDERLRPSRERRPIEDESSRRPGNPPPPPPERPERPE